MISARDKERLRFLADKQLAHAKSPEMEKITAKWHALGTGRRFDPPVRMSFGAYRDEIITPDMTCENDNARRIEESLLANMAGRELFDDDTVVPDHYMYYTNMSFNLWNTAIRKKFLDDPNEKKYAFHIEPIVNNLREDISVFKKSIFSADTTGSKNEMDEINNAIGDILPVRPAMHCLGGSITNKLVHLMGMETMYISMMDYPDEFHTIMKLACEGYEEFFKWMADENLYTGTTEMQPLGQDTYCYTDELPAQARSSKDVWGYMDSQESIGLSPEMYGEFVFPYLSRIASNMGLVSYGCCEPVHPQWDYISTLKNLRRVSVSPWCDEEFMGEQLRGKRIVYHRKPKASFVLINKPLDEGEITEYFKRTALAARGCLLEVTQREIKTIHGNPERVKQYLKMIRKTLDKYWQP